MLVDTHAHLDFPEFTQDLPSVLERAVRADVRTIVTVGIDIERSRQAVDLARSHRGIYATVGIHPHDAFMMDEESLRILRDLALRERVVALGEIGLDYYRDRQPRAVQRACLRRQLELALQVKLPVVFHIREAFGDFFEIVSDFAPSLRGGVLHCFSGDWEIAEKCLNMGFYISIPGTVTFAKAETLQNVVRNAPGDRLLLETDCPYLAPVPFRGKTNEPSYVRHTAVKVAELRNCSLDALAEETTENAFRIFNMNRSERLEGHADASAG